MAPTTTLERPTCLLIPDCGGVTGRHWLAQWQRRHEHFRILDMAEAEDGGRNSWLSRLDRHVELVRSPVVLVAHGVGALAVAWWAALLGKRAARRVAGALLVAPPDPERAGAGERIRCFAPFPTAMLPFPSIVVASADDPHVSVDRAREMAGEWVSDFYDIGPAGPLGPEAKLGYWPAGERLLDILMSGGPGLSRYAYRAEPVLRTERRRAQPPRVGAGLVGQCRQSS
jgi:predicted alpha/beta hydrolase family esterase